MIIIAQNGQCAVNYDNCCIIRRNGCYILAYMNDGSDIAMAVYTSEERCGEVYSALINALANANSDTRISLNGDKVTLPEK